MLYLKRWTNPFYEADGGTSGTGEEAGAKSETVDANAAGEADADVKEADRKSDGSRNTGEGAEIDVKAEAQKMADAIVAKKLKDMPSKEQVAEYKANKSEFDAYMKFKAQMEESRKTDEDKAVEAEQKAELASAEISRKQREIDAKIAALDAGIVKDYLADAVVLAMARVGDDGSFEEAMAAIVAKNPKWTGKGALPEEGGNPAVQAVGLSPKPIPKIF